MTYALTKRHSLLAPILPLAVCTVYDPCLPDPLMQRLTTTALSVFNDCILREAFSYRLPVLDLRLICTEVGDFASEIEPRASGARKTALGVLNLAQTHDFSWGRAVIYKWRQQ